jgi:3'(2'), 5'-bisphosphate nucleotidase
MPPSLILPSVLTQLLATVDQIAKTAGERIMEIYSTEDFAVEQKSDNSPLTRADMAAHETIIAGLQQLTPVYPILSEESTDIPYTERAQWSPYWLVDPLDGTREFIKRNGEFTVNIALIEQKKPVLGVIYVPVTGISYFAAVGNGAFKCLPQQLPQPITVRTCPQDKLIVVGSRSHASQSLHDFIDKLRGETEVELISIGSSLKSCLVAEGKADIYPRFGLTSEWDTAAAQCIVEQAGGYLTDLQFNPLRYNTKESVINPHFIVFGDVSKNWPRYL